jgi:hypothetical protein
VCIRIHSRDALLVDVVLTIALACADALESLSLRDGDRRRDGHRDPFSLPCYFLVAISFEHSVTLAIKFTVRVEELSDERTRV